MANFLNQVPQASQTLGQTQNLILQNFTTIDAAFQVDHVPYTTPGQGKHNKVTFPLQPAGPAPTFLVTEAGFYNKLDPFTALNQLFIVPPNTGIPIPMTAVNSSSPGWSYLPTGIFIQWGSTTINAGLQVSVGYATPFPTNVFSTIITPSYMGSSPIAPSVSLGPPAATPKSNFLLNNAGPNNATVYWFAIGN